MNKVRKMKLQICDFFLHFVVIFISQKSPTLVTINETNERMTGRFGLTQTYVFNFWRMKKKRLKILERQISKILIFIRMKNIFSLII